ncbi:hypothetical protein DVH24_029009 [Malus domestica]|uniref:Uncharacterized protein n=1 Tax=Malus domestica TaxID=3750 RepID=A0A498HRW4_MALDO|nr:hypothetical protein DVH24_029009 [Malus domestica]
MEESMNDLRRSGWLAIAANVSARAAPPPPPMDKRVLTEGGRNCDLVRVDVEVSKCTEKMSEEGGIYAGGWKSTVPIPVGALDRGLAGGDIELDKEKEGGKESQANPMLLSLCFRLRWAGGSGNSSFIDLQCEILFPSLTSTISPFQPSEAQSWIKVAYWYSGSEFPISDINSPLFTHLIYAYTDVNSSSYELSSSSSDSSEQYYSTFTPTVKRKNPSVTTLVSIGGGNADYGVISTMLSSSSHRKSFLFEEWRAAIASEAAKTSQTPLILTAAVLYRPDFESFAYPVESIRDNLNWVHVVSYAYYEPQRTNFTGAHAALYDPSSDLSTDYGIKSWIGRGLSASKLVLGLPSYGYAWTLSNPRDSAIGAPAKGPAITKVGSMSYKDIKGYIDRYGADIVYNATYVAKYCVIGSAWIGFDDAEVVKIKVSYAKEQKLLGYFIWQVSLDDNWVLSLAAAAQEGGGSGQNKRRLLVIVLTTIASVILLLGSALSYFRMRLHKSKAKESESRENDIADTAGKFNSNVPNLKIFSIADVEAATDGFSIENKLGEGGYGPVYKGVLQDGQEIAVKKLSKASTQGFEEFKNEVMLTAKLQHVNLVRVLGFCIEHHEQMLIYEYMPKKSLDLYLFGNSILPLW